MIQAEKNTMKPMAINHVENALTGLKACCFYGKYSEPTSLLEQIDLILATSY